MAKPRDHFKRHRASRSCPRRNHCALFAAGRARLPPVPSQGCGWCKNRI